MKKIGIVTTTRAEYGLLEPLINMISQDDILEPYLIVSGSHLSQQHGYSKDNIKFPIDEEIEIQLDSDTPCGVCKSLGLTIIGFADLFKRVKLDGIILLGDRSELLSIALSSYINGVKIFHLHGGEISGNLDNAFRYMISKMANLHFVSHETYRDNLVKEGIDQQDIHVVGALGCDGLKPYREDRYGFLVIYHPNTLEDENWQDLFTVLAERDDFIIFIMPNSDNGGREIKNKIIKFRSEQWGKYFKNLEREEYIELLSRVKAIIGNSSSGIIEAPALATLALDVGSRQKGRLRASSIIHCEMKVDSIREAFKKLESPEFQQSLNNIERPYRGEDVADKIIKIIKERFIKSS